MCPGSRDRLDRQLLHCNHPLTNGSALYVCVAPAGSRRQRRHEKTARQACCMRETLCAAEEATRCSQYLSNKLGLWISQGRTGSCLVLGQQLSATGCGKCRSMGGQTASAVCV